MQKRNLVVIRSLESDHKKTSAEVFLILGNIYHKRFKGIYVI